MTKMHQNVPFKLGKEEVASCKSLFIEICAQEGGARKLLEANFEDGARIYEEIARGADEFYTLSAQDVTSDEIRKKLTAAIAGLSPAAQYRYLTNVLVAMSYTGSTLYSNDAWMNHIDDCKTILAAMDAGMMDENHPEIGRKITQLMNLVSSHIESSAVLLIGKPHYEQLMNACLVSNPDEVELLAANTREASIAMAAAIYTLSAKGNLPSLNQEAYTPYTMGVMSAYLLDVDALQKNAVWEFAKPLLINAARAALTLTIGFGHTAVSFIIGSAAFLIAAMLTEHLVLSAIIGGIFALPSLIGGLKCVKGETEDAMYIGAKIINYSAAAARTAYYHLSDWIHNTVVPVMWPKWEAASAFVRKHVIEPGAEFICKIRSRAEEGCAAAKEKLGTFIDEVNDTANRVAPQTQNHPAPVREAPAAAAPQGEICNPYGAVEPTVYV